jgi:type VII secretion integral membrane protein EccD
MVAFSRVTVIGSSRRIDVSLPDGVPVAELVLDLVQMLDESSDSVPARWALLRIGGQPLDAEQSLAEQGVASGTMLFVRDLTAPPPPPVVDDFAQDIAIAVDAETGRWTASMLGPLLTAVAAVCLLAAGGALLLGGTRGVQTVAGVVGAALASLAALALVRLAGRRDFAAVVSVAGLPLWSAAGAGLAGVGGLHPTGILAAALAAVTIGAAVALLISGDAILAISSGVIAATVLPAVVLGGCELFGLGVVAGAAILCPVGLAAIALSTPLAARLAGVIATDAASVDRKVSQGRGVLAALLTGTALVLAASSAALAASGGLFAWALIAVTAVAAGMRARHHRFAAEVAPLLAAAMAGALLLEFPLATRGGTAVAATLLIADAIVLTAGAGAIRAWNLPGQISRRLGTIEWIAIAASVPLAAGVLGVYDAVARFARGLS